MPKPQRPGPIVEDQKLAELMGLSMNQFTARDSRPVPTFRYDENRKRQAHDFLHKMLRGVGDARWGRFFRMNLTHCLHRGLTDAEIAALPADWHAAEAKDIAGGPVEVFWSVGVVPGAVSANPCENPTRHYLSEEIWLPIDCGECAPCRARRYTMETGQPCNAQNFC